MKQTTLLAIAAALSAIALEFSGGESPAAETNGGDAGADVPKRGRGRPPGGGGAADAGKATGKTYEELQAIIKPIIEAGNGPELKKVIVKYSPTGIKDLKVEDQAAFLKDVDALAY